MQHIEQAQAYKALLPAAVALQALLPPGDTRPAVELAKHLPPALSEMQFKRTPLNAYEIGILRQEACDMRLSAEARAYAQRRLELEGA
jgi:hypothetical protein